MDVERDSYNFDENQKSDKRKLTSENSPVNHSSYSTPKVFSAKYDETNWFEGNKKLCTWHPPLKSEKELIPNEYLENVNFRLNAHSNVNLSLSIKQTVVESELPQTSVDHSKLQPLTSYENEEGDMSKFVGCSTIHKINNALYNYNDSDQEVRSLPSSDKLRDEFKGYEVINEKEKNISSLKGTGEEIDVRSNDEDCLNNKMEKEIVTYKTSNGNENSDMTEKNVKSGNYEQLQNLNANLAFTKKTDMIYQFTKEIGGKELKIDSLGDKCLLKEGEQFCISRYHADDKTSGLTVAVPDETGSATNFGIQGEHVASNNNDNKRYQQHIAYQSKESVMSKVDTYNDDSFDLSFTNSQIEKLECDESRAFCNSYSNTSTLWIRKKQQQKEILRKIIREIDILNNSIVGATKELRSQFCKNYSK